MLHAILNKFLHFCRIRKDLIYSFSLLSLNIRYSSLYNKAKSIVSTILAPRTFIHGPTLIAWNEFFIKSIVLNDLNLFNPKLSLKDIHSSNMTVKDTLLSLLSTTFLSYFYFYLISSIQFFLSYEMGLRCNKLPD